MTKSMCKPVGSLMLVVGLVMSSATALGGVTGVSITLSGPTTRDVDSPSDVLAFTVATSYTLDAETQVEYAACEAAIITKIRWKYLVPEDLLAQWQWDLVGADEATIYYYWKYLQKYRGFCMPFNVFFILVGGGQSASDTDGDNLPFGQTGNYGDTYADLSISKYYDDDLIVEVEYEVTVRYKDGTSGTSSDTDRITVTATPRIDAVSPRVGAVPPTGGSPNTVSVTITGLFPAAMQLDWVKFCTEHDDDGDNEPDPDPNILVSNESRNGDTTINCTIDIDAAAEPGDRAVSVKLSDGGGSKTLVKYRAFTVIRTRVDTALSTPYIAWSTGTADIVTTLEPMDKSGMFKLAIRKTDDETSDPVKLIETGKPRGGEDSMTDTNHWNGTKIDGSPAPADTYYAHAEWTVDGATARDVFEITVAKVELEIGSGAYANMVCRYSTDPPGRPLTWCQARVYGLSLGNLTVVVTNVPGDGELRFPDLGDEEKVLTLSSNGAWQPFAVSGQVASEDMHDAVIEVHHGTSGGAVLTRAMATVVWVDVGEGFCRTDDVSLENSRYLDYLTDFNTDDLGCMFDQATPQAPCHRAGIELWGLVFPSDLPAGFLSWRRMKVKKRTYHNGVEYSNECEDNVTDTCHWSDTDPAPNSTVYDLDSPTLAHKASLPEGSIRSRRTNFAQWVNFGLIDRCSNDVRWFERQSIKKSDFATNAWIRDYTIGTDNEIGPGTTSTRCDLSEE